MISRSLFRFLALRLFILQHLPWGLLNSSYYFFFKLNIHINPSLRHYTIRAFEKECINMDETDLTRLLTDIPQTGCGNNFRIA